MQLFDVVLILPRQDIEPVLSMECSETGWWQHIGHGILAMEAKNSGLTFKIIDANTFDSHKEFIIYLKNEIRANIVGITPSITSVRNTIDILSIVKQTYQSVKTILGGQMVSQPIAAKKFISNCSGLIDAICIGDGRGIFSHGLNKLYNNIRDGYENLIPAKNFHNATSSWSYIVARSFTSPISSGHPIDYKLCYDLNKYWRKYKINYLKTKGVVKYSKPIVLQTMQGCPNRNMHKSCLFCDRIEKNLRFNNITCILNELENIIKSGGDSVIIVDDNGIFSNKLVSNEISKKWPKELGIVFMYSNIIDITVQNVERLKAMNCEKLFIGIESGDDNCIRSFGKNYNRKQVVEAVKLLNNYDIKVSPSFVIGAPPSDNFLGETKKSIENTIKLATTLMKMKNVDLAFSNILIPCEGSRAYDTLLSKLPNHIKNKIEKDLFTRNEYMQELWCNYVLNISYSETKKYQLQIEKLFSNFIKMYRD
jgi:radical SAM superfamily enzyme YgiQ (UPF0313 family)